MNGRSLLFAAALAALLFAVRAPICETPDSPTYLTPARSWASGQGLREADGSPLSYRMPAFPLALGLTIRIFGDSESHRAIGIMNVVFLFFAALLVRRAILPSVGGISADLVGAVTIIYPPLLTSTALLLQEVFLAFLIAVLFWALCLAVAQPGVSTSSLAGTALGVAALGKPTVLGAGLPLLLLVCLTGPERAKRGASFALAATVILAPWAARNQMIVGRFELAPGNAGHSFLGGTVSNRIDDWYAFPEYQGAVREWESRGPEVEVSLDRHLARVAVRRILDNPVRWAALCVERVGRFILPARTWFVQVGLSRTGTFSPLYLLATAMNVVMFALTAGLAVRAFRTRDPVLAVGPAIVFSHMLVYAISYASPRYAVTVGPVLLASSALALKGILRARASAG